MKSWRNEKLASRGLPRAVLFKTARSSRRVRGTVAGGVKVLSENLFFELRRVLREAAERRQKQATARRACNSY